MKLLKRVILENLDSISFILFLFIFFMFFALPINVSLALGSIVLIPLFFVITILKFCKKLPKKEKFKLFKRLRVEKGEEE